jgi:hypothetical protein
MSEGIEVIDINGEDQISSSSSSSSSGSGDGTRPDFVVCFSSPSFYYNEDEGLAEVDVMRLGSAAVECSCKWRTQAGKPRCASYYNRSGKEKNCSLSSLFFAFTRVGSAKDGHEYVGAKGEVFFAAGERHARICVALLPDPAWSHDVFFEVILSDLTMSNGSVRACIVVPKTKVWIINIECFPSGCPAHPWPEYMMYSFFLERCTARGKKVRNTAWCYVYKAFFDCTIESIALEYIINAAIIAGRYSDNRESVSER